MSIPPANDPHRARRTALNDWTVRAGAVALLVLLVFAWTYYRERMACADSAFFSWLLIDAKHPVSVLGRYGSWIPQLPAVLLIRWGAPLELVLRCYSISLVAVHVVILWLVAGPLRDRRAAFVLPIALTAGFHYMFYFAISELYQGMSLTVLLWVLLRRWLVAGPGRQRVLMTAACVLLNAWISFYHQLLVLPLVFLLVHEGMSRGANERRGIALMGASMVAWYVIRIVLMSDSGYEQSRMPSWSDLLLHGTRLMELESMTYLLSVWTKFPALLLLMVAGIAAGVMRRAWLSTAWVIGFSTAFLALVLIVDREGGAVTIYENYYPLLGLFWAIHLIHVLPEEGRIASFVTKASFATVVLLGLRQIQQGHHLFTEKVAYLERITNFWEVQDARKLVVGRGSFPWRYGMGIWPLATESAMASAIGGPAHASTIYVTDHEDDSVPGETDHERFIGPTWSPDWFRIPTLDRRYFDFPTDTGYIRVNSVDSAFDLSTIQLRPPSSPFVMSPDQLSVVPIVIHNPSSRKMPSCSSEKAPIRLGYRLFVKDGAEIGRGRWQSAIETDIPAGMTYHQGLVIERPAEPGLYWVIADLLVDGEPFGKYVTFDIVVN